MHCGDYRDCIGCGDGAVGVGDDLSRSKIAKPASISPRSRRARRSNPAERGNRPLGNPICAVIAPIFHIACYATLPQPRNAQQNVSCAAWPAPAFGDDGGGLGSGHGHIIRPALDTTHLPY